MSGAAFAYRAGHIDRLTLGGLMKCYTKTATIIREHLYGTHRYQLWVTYKGVALRWTEGTSSCFAIVQDDAQDTSIEIAKNHARRFGFTHVKFAGDWEKRTKPRGGKLTPAPVGV